MKKQFLLGLMAMTLPLTAWAADEEGPWKVEIAESVTYAGDNTLTAIENTISVSVQEEDGTWTPVTKGQDYTITYSGDVRNAGEYTLTITGKGNYRFLPAKEGVAFEVTPKTVNGEDYSLELKKGGVSKVYGEDDQEVLDELVATIPDGVLESGTAERTDFLKCLEVARYGSSDGQDVAEYTVYVKGLKDTEGNKVNSNYRYLEPKDGSYTSLTINPRELTLTFPNKRIYNGIAVNLATLKNTGYHKFEGIIEKDVVGIKSLKEKEGKEVKNAGEYTLVAELDNDNYTLPDNGEVTYTVDQKELVITAKTNNAAEWNTATYGDSNISTVFTTNFDYKDFVEGEQETSGLTMQRAEGDNVAYDENGKLSGYAIMPYVDDTVVELDENGENNEVLPNYIIKYTVKETFTINPLDITEELNVEVVKEKLTYQGVDFVLSNDMITVKKGSGEQAETLTVGTDYTYARSEAVAKNAGDTFTVTVTAKGNYTGTKTTEEYSIAQAPLVITPKKVKDEEGNETNEYVTIGKTYDGGDEPTSDELMAYYDFTNFVNKETANTIGLTMVKQDGKDVGSYYVRLYKDGEQVRSGDYGTKFGNYKVEYNVTGNETKYYITKKDLTYHIDATSATKKYDATDALPEFKFVSTDDEELGEDVFGTAPKVAVKLAENQTAAKDVDTYVLEVTEEGKSKNYNVTYKAPEGGDKYTITPSTVTITIGNKTVEFEDYDKDLSEEALAKLVQNTDFTKIDNDPKADGTGRLAIRNMITLTLGDNVKKATDTYDGGLVATIKSEGLTDAEKTVLKNYGYGLKDEEGKATNFIINNGTLIIGSVTNKVVFDASIVDVEDVEEEADEAETPETLSVAKTLEKYNGATADTVIIKNMRNFMGDVTGNEETGMTINAEQWYTLVLPFEVSVRDLSYAFGYAIVNIPDEDNSSTDGAHFKLTMQTVPANTLMAFKVDQTMVWDADKEVVFTNKKIVAPGEDHVVCDKAPTPNYFIGVYKKQEINDYNDLYLLPTNGKFYHSSSTSKTIMIYPLNGYVHIGEANSARVYMQEADGSTTAINAVTGEVIRDVEGWYTVGGMKLNGEPTQKGVYINNGKKVVIK